MKAIKAIAAFGRMAGIAARAMIGVALLLKVWMLNNPHCSLAEDPLENWIALGIVYLLWFPRRIEP